MTNMGTRDADQGGRYQGDSGEKQETKPEQRLGEQRWENAFDIVKSWLVFRVQLDNLDNLPSI